mmetsp:Transcript_21878/g.30436  ORF Transcript_21878/g.30436 Transcript_21878/m.30436 type:complete len:503 (-) Transcript_21878:139-1647(-)
MGRACLIDEIVQKHLSRLLSARTQVEVGLVLGRLSVGNKDMVLSLARIPPISAENSEKAVQAGSKKTNNQTSGLAVILTDSDWLVEHGRQVSSMLPGGLDVVGVYALAPETAFKSELLSLVAAVRALAAMSAEYRMTPASTSMSGGMSAEPHLLLHVDSKTSKYSVRHCQVDLQCGARVAGDGTHPAEYKFGSAVNSFHHLTCQYQVDVQIPVPVAPGSSLRNHFKSALNLEDSRLLASEVVYNGRLLPPSETLSALLGPPGASECVDICSPLSGASVVPPLTKPQPNISQPCQGVVRVRGVVSAHAYVHTREAGDRVQELIKQDIHSSLRARLALLAEDADREDDELEDSAETDENISPNLSRHPLSVSKRGASPLTEITQMDVVSLPVRVQLPWLGGICLYDHLMPGETAQDACERLQELLGESNASITVDVKDKVEFLENESNKCQDEDLILKSIANMKDIEDKVAPKKKPTDLCTLLGVYGAVAMIGAVLSYAATFLF